MSFYYEITITNKIKTYLGALEVIEKILFGSKYLNIINKFKFNFIMKKYSDQECRGR